MAIEIEPEKLVTLTEATKVLPQRPHVRTVWRWHRRGIHGIRLETILIGRTRDTSREAVQRFAERTTAVVDGITPKQSASRARQQAVAQANADLDAAEI
jgi:hypothetical protein